ncbi:MAG TPA: NUDIX domain-containing protein [Candidatus Saccharimonadales bacterium]|nr:NUDIX domain-containing protein [Candidatus Saccharimonadales bacterium]
MHPPVVVVDDHDNEVGSAPLAEVRQKGLYHRVVAVFVIDNKGRMLLQLRGTGVKVYPNYWDQAAGGHVDQGQTYQTTAISELAEELGLYNLALTELGTYRSNTQEGDRLINQFERVYKVAVPHDIALNPEKSEINKLQWFTPLELKLLITRQANTCTPGLLHDLAAYFPEFSPDEL